MVGRFLDHGAASGGDVPARCLVRAAGTGPSSRRSGGARTSSPGWSPCWARRRFRRRGPAAEGPAEGRRHRRDPGRTRLRRRLSRVKPVYPSFSTALPDASADTIVPDLPPADRSLNPSYAGNGL
ncbi:hypothetical protein Shyhy01_32280 [Streptomyces hygroscopicus subsp. hygroscopicus]|nr:hypothetical protein Shyhy01_32280 [Streptomyces hygroscopicus subsp. hygroscopicus]